MSGQVVVLRDAALLAEAAAARLVTRLVDVQAARGHAHVVLTGGGVGIATLAALARAAARDAVDWSALDVWWGDERFLPAGDPERNATQARSALLYAVPLDPARVHEMPASDGPHGDDVDAAARVYAAELAAAAGPGSVDGPWPGVGGAVPAFDVVLLGVGPDGHIASLFPEHAGVGVTDRTVIGVQGSPKPPPTRVSLTLPAVNAAREVWLLAAGAEKAPAVGRALAGAAASSVPAAGAQGTDLTLWLLDRAAAGTLAAPSRIP